MVAAITSGNAYVARGTIAKLGQLKSFFKKGLQRQIEGKGFAFIEALSACPTSWRTNAEETWNFIEKEMTQYFKVGEIKAPGQDKGD